MIKLIPIIRMNRLTYLALGLNGNKNLAVSQRDSNVLRLPFDAPRFAVAYPAELW